MGRLVDMNDVYNVLTEYYHHKTATQHMVLADALGTVKTADAIPISWIESHLHSYLREDASVCDGIGSVYIRAMLEKWREEQKGSVT